MLIRRSVTMYLVWLTRVCPGNLRLLPLVLFHPGTMKSLISNRPELMQGSARPASAAL